MTHPLPPARVLLVDDIEENLIALEAVLRRFGLEIVLARSGQEALEQLLVHDFALALLDVNMPEMDGFQLAELMRGTLRTRGVPIIFVTATYEPQRVFKGYDAGAVDFLIKPVDAHILRSKVETFILLHDQKRQLAAQLTQLELMTGKLQESLRLQETFVAALNHDLRQPLHAISLGTEILSSELLAPAQQNVIRRIETASDRMNTMLDQLYDVARARLGAGITLQAAPGDLRELVEGVLHEAELRRGNRQLTLEVRGDTRGTWDRPRIGRVIANLISNAISHGTDGTPVHTRVDGDRADEVRISVRNGGVIPEGLLPRIFEPFKSGDRASNQGLGLGLYIVREITHAHGGTVTVTSTAEAGTTFEVCLPRDGVVVPIRATGSTS